MDSGGGLPSPAPPQYKRLRLCLKKTRDAAAVNEKLKSSKDTSDSGAVENGCNPILLHEEKIKIVTDEGIVTCSPKEDALQDRIQARRYPSGLRNIGNTCYLAVVVQLLRHLPIVLSNIRHLASMADQVMMPSSTSVNLLLALDSLITAMSAKERTPSLSAASSCETPNAVLAALRKASPSFSGGGQHDAQECLQGLLGHIDSAWSAVTEVYRRTNASLTSSAAEDSSCTEQSDSGVLPSDTGLAPMALTVPNGDSSISSSSSTMSCTGEHSVSSASSSLSKSRLSHECMCRRVCECPGSSSTGDSGFGFSVVPAPIQRAGAGIHPAGKDTIEECKQQTVRRSTRTRSSSGREQGDNEQPARINGRAVSCGSQSLPACQLAGAESQSESADRSLGVVAACFQGEMQASTRCAECELAQYRAELFTDLSVPVCRESSLARSMTNSSLTAGRAQVAAHSLPWCIGQLMCPRSGLAGINKYQCSQCRHSTEATISYRFTALPSVLLFHLKRFTTVRIGKAMSSVKKIHGNIATPLELSLLTWCRSDCPNRDKVYSLVSVIMHAGSSSSTGHYTVYCRENRCPRRMEDTPVRPATNCAQVASSNPGIGNGNSAGAKRSPSSRATSEGCVYANLNPVDSESLNGSAAADSTSTNSSPKSTSTSASGCDMQQSTSASAASSPSWLYFDDAKVQRVSEDDLVLAMSPLKSGSRPTMSPYILCYAIT